jgi:hypothetical protein
MANDPGLGEGGTTQPIAAYAVSATGGTSSGTGTRTASRTTRTTLQQAQAVKDASGTNLSTNDSSGFGLNRPFHLWNVYETNLETDPAATPVRSTTSGTFGALWTASSEPQHPKIRVRVRVVNGAGTSGEVKLVDRATGTTLSSVLVVGVAATVEADLEGALISPVLFGAGAPMRVDVQARRTAGANTVAVLVMHAFGKGT